MTLPIRVVHYLNQFFAGLGGEEAAGSPPQWFDGARGPGQLIARSSSFDVVGTLVAGDDYVAGQLEQSVAELIDLLRCELASRPVDVLLAGPAFNAGRYGMACAALCARVEAELGIPALTAVYTENPAVDSYRRQVMLVRAGDDVMSMGKDMAQLLRVASKRVRGEAVDADVDGTITKGLRENYFAQHTGAERAVNMVMDRLAGKPFRTEYAMPVFDRVAPAPAIADAGQCTIALVTSGGIVPRGNPDRIEAANASRYGEYSIAELDRLSGETQQSVHGGYDPTFANQDPNRVLPLDAARDLERSGRIGRLHPSYFATVGNATSVERAKRYGAQIAARLINEGVQAVVFTSTWGTCTRCGATMVKELERAGLPTAHVCSIIPISKTVGANRIVPAIAIPHPLGEPSKSTVEELQIRRALLEKALHALEQDVQVQTVFSTGQTS